MKLVFLDVDGVLNNRESMRNCGGDIFRVNPKCVDQLNRICSATGAVCVLSSTWRINWTAAAFQQFLEKHGFTGLIVDRTPRMQREERGTEIAAYLNQCADVGYPAEAFVILDDDSDMGPLMPFLVQTKTETGLEKKHADQAIHLLDPESFPKVGP